ncbi:Heme d1 biosynthesis protein NirF [hydrothermal vent metagenome]|uniref:Heme d1 biosynthesis protein NirF n=1 Tax=hydrothermal vent metagenome TaxID=652676 RepID=A0A3B1CHS1_9ZZZZ
MRSRILFTLLTVLFLVTPVKSSNAGDWGTGALMVIIERETSSVLVLDSAQNDKVLGRIKGLGLLHHATISFSRDGRYGYVISRDSLLSKIDLIKLELTAQIKVGESAVGLAVTQDGKYIAVSNYKPGNITIVSNETFKIVKTIDADKSKTVGLVDAPDDKLVVSLMDANEIWIIDTSTEEFPVIKKLKNVGVKPYDALLTPDGRYYMAGFFHSPWIGMVDLWNLDKGIRKIPLPVPDDKKGQPPVLKIPHLEGWIMAGGNLYAPVIGGSGLAVIDPATWRTKKFIPLLSYPVFAMARPDMRQIWANFVMGENNDAVQVVDVKTQKVVKTLRPGKKIFHMNFSPKGKKVYFSSYGDDKVAIYDTKTFKLLKEIPVKKPSGIFCTDRAHKFGL